MGTPRQAVEPSWPKHWRQSRTISWVGWCDKRCSRSKSREFWFGCNRGLHLNTLFPRLHMGGHHLLGCHIFHLVENFLWFCEGELRAVATLCFIVPRCSSYGRAGGMFIIASVRNALAYVAWATPVVRQWSWLAVHPSFQQPFLSCNEPDASSGGHSLNLVILSHVS